MPLYEYQCDACAHRFELIQKFSDAPADTCPKCGGAVKKLLSSPAIQFKGSGWYVTDYAKSGRSAGASSSKSESAGEAAGSAKPESTSETKSTAKPESKPAGKPTSSSSD
ncbi:MAG: zinc ribbon domain-containing protein [Acidobacteria bacterium]|nr:zinc ribbon domain-containing protein [Acidobacteriota bacterium]